jgi:hypothetical protein
VTVPRWLIIGGLVGLAWTFLSLVVGFVLGAWFKAQEADWRRVDLQHDLADAHLDLDRVKEELAAYREAFPLTAMAIERHRSVN